MLVLGLLEVPGLSRALQRNTNELLGPLLFCPVSAALFFGSLVPLSLQHGSKSVLPVVYGLGTAVPVVLLG